MARKMNNSKTSLETCGQAAAGNRQPMPPMAAFYQALIRPHALKDPPPRLRLQIAIQVEAPQEAPRPVKIIQFDSN